MKIKTIPALLALILGSLVLYGYMACGAVTKYALISAIVAWLFLESVLAIRIATGSNRTVLFPTVSAILLAVMFPLDIVFTWLQVAFPVVIIVNALAVVGWLFALNAALSSQSKTE